MKENISSQSALIELEPENSKELFTINEVAEELKVHQQTLRNWERKKLVSPLRVGSRRVYNRQHIECCKKIKEFSGKGVSLRGVREILKKI